MSNETRKLSRRNFLKTSAAGAAAISLAANAKGETFDPLLEAPQSQSSRVIIPLNHDWLYSEKPPANATAAIIQRQKLHPRNHSAHEQDASLAAASTKRNTVRLALSAPFQTAEGIARPTHLR